MERVFYEDVFRALNRHGVRYLIVGGVAVNLSGVPRMTKDLDLMLDLSPGNLALFLSAVRDLGYRPRAEDLIRLKALANRLQDKSDIAMLRKVQDER